MDLMTYTRTLLHKQFQTQMHSCKLVGICFQAAQAFRNECLQIDSQIKTTQIISLSTDLYYKLFLHQTGLFVDSNHLFLAILLLVWGRGVSELELQS